MILKEEKRDLFKVDGKYYLAHCISSDCAMGAGIAVEFQKKYNLKRTLLSNGFMHRKHPSCILVNKVFNLITKDLYWHKPTYESLKVSLIKMKEIIQSEKEHGVNIEYLAIPKIGSGLDRLQWGKVREIIEDVFKDMDIKILVCYL